MKEKVLRRLVIKPFHITNVQFSEKTSIEKGTLSLNLQCIDTIKKSEELITDIKVDIIKPGDYNREINTIMDIIPISTKVLGSLGEGITHTLTGVYVMLTGVDEDGRQMHEFGSSEGILSEQMIFGRYGTPSTTDYIIHIGDLRNGVNAEGKVTHGKSMWYISDEENWKKDLRDIINAGGNKGNNLAHKWQEWRERGEVEGGVNPLYQRTTKFILI